MVGTHRHGQFLKTHPLALRYTIYGRERRQWRYRCTRKGKILADDTAHSLYKKLKIAERQLFKKSIPLITKNTLHRMPQNDVGTSHKRSDLFDLRVQQIDLDKPTTARQVLNQIRALTTSEPKEAAYFLNGKYKVRVTINYDNENNS